MLPASLAQRLFLFFFLFIIHIHQYFIFESSLLSHCNILFMLQPPNRNVLHIVARASARLLQPPFKYLSISAHRLSTAATRSPSSQPRRGLSHQNNVARIMSSNSWGYHGGDPSTSYGTYGTYGTSNPTYYGGQLPPQFQPPHLTSTMSDMPREITTPPPRSDSSPYSPPSVIGSRKSRSPSPANVGAKNARPGKHHTAKKLQNGRDPKIQPSAASGGVPVPSSEYLILSSYPPFQLPHARKILVVIDLNGTLLYRPSRHNPTLFIERPHARIFLNYCIETFKVVIWSSAKPNNVSRMCEQLLTPKQRSQVVAVWGRDRFGLSPDDYNQRVLCYKRLSTLWADPDVAASHPDFARGGGWSQSDTLLVDDSVEKGLAEPYNIIEIPEFKGDAVEQGYILPQVHDYINECSRQADISTYIRNQPFRAVPGWQLPPPNSI
ncbi:HAD-like domain-containing protein [Daldinia sp. FL1419]|nr:HAD-like domain-containing protein [Daldinia sp. FL1419]